MISDIPVKVEGLREFLKDSGERREFGTGAVRDSGGKEFRRYDLLPSYTIYRLAMHYGKGAKKYAARNWEKGIPLSEFYNSAMSHQLKLMAGYTDEDHESAWLWNVACFIETKHRIKAGILSPDLDDMPKTFEKLEPTY